MIVNTVPNAKFGLAFCESSGPCLIRSSANDKELKESAPELASRVGAGHSFVILLKNAYPINMLSLIRNVPEVVNLHAATANSLQVVLAETEQGRGILGVVDGLSPKGIEKEKDVEEREQFLRRIGYRL